MRPSRPACIRTHAGPRRNADSETETRKHARGVQLKGENAVASRLEGLRLEPPTPGFDLKLRSGRLVRRPGEHGAGLNSHGTLRCDILLAVLAEDEAAHTVAEPRDTALLPGKSLLDEERIVGAPPELDGDRGSSMVGSAVAWTNLRNSVLGLGADGLGQSGRRAGGRGWRP